MSAIFLFFYFIEESIEVDDTPIVYTNSVAEHLITMVEVDVSPRTIEQVKVCLIEYFLLNA